MLCIWSWFPNKQRINFSNNHFSYRAKIEVLFPVSFTASLTQIMTYERSTEISCERFCGIIATALAMGIISSLLGSAFEAGAATLPEVVQVTVILTVLVLTTIVVSCALIRCIDVCCNGSEAERDELFREATDTYIAWSIADALFDDD